MFAERDAIHLLSRQLYLSDSDPFALFEKLMATEPNNMGPSHAFYLGYEMAKATTALTLGKNYEQDESLNWGFLTRDEVSHRLKKSKRSSRQNPNDDSNEGQQDVDPGGGVGS